MQVTIYKNLAEVKNGFYRDVDFIFKRIKDGASKDLVEQIRTYNGDPTELKKRLPAINFQGIFKERNDSGLESFSGLLVLDFDKFATKEEAINFKDSICDDEYIFSCWISPSALGVKILIKVPGLKENHKGYFQSLKNILIIQIGMIPVRMLHELVLKVTIRIFT